jgi:hypothetical protein
VIISLGKEKQDLAIFFIAVFKYDDIDRTEEKGLKMYTMQH